MTLPGRSLSWLGIVRQPGADEFSRYLAVSVIALLTDFLILWVVSRVTHYLAAATMGFVFGSIVSYLLATRWAFRNRRLIRWARAEFAIYVAVGVAGLFINNLVIFLAVEYLGMDVLGGKALAACATFVFNFAARKLALF